MSFTADRVLVFGATGDLARRMLLPSHFALDADGRLEPGLEMVCTARTELDTPGFRKFAREALEHDHLRLKHSLCFRGNLRIRRVGMCRAVSRCVSRLPRRTARLLFAGAS
jgi:hypothetical protein